MSTATLKEMLPQQQQQVTVFRRLLSACKYFQLNLNLTWPHHLCVCAEDRVLALFLYFSVEARPLALIAKSAYFDAGPPTPTRQNLCRRSTVLRPLCSQKADQLPRHTTPAIGQHPSQKPTIHVHGTTSTYIDTSPPNTRPLGRKLTTADVGAYSPRVVDTTAGHFFSERH